MGEICFYPPLIRDLASRMDPPSSPHSPHTTHHTPHTLHTHHTQHYTHHSSPHITHRTPHSTHTPRAATPKNPHILEIGHKYFTKIEERKFLMWHQVNCQGGGPALRQAGISSPLDRCSFDVRLGSSIYWIGCIRTWYGKLFTPNKTFYLVTDGKSGWEKKIETFLGEGEENTFSMAVTQPWWKIDIAAINKRAAKRIYVWAAPTSSWSEHIRGKFEGMFLS